MVKELSQLNNFIIESVKPDRLAGIELTEKDFKRWSEFVSKTTRVLDGYIKEAVNAQTFRAARRISPLLNGLIELINITCSYNRERVLRGSSDFQKILRFYRFTCESMEDLLVPLRNQARFNDIRVSAYMRPDVKIGLRNLLNDLVRHLESIKDDDDLIALLFSLLRRRITKTKLTWQDVIEIKQNIAYLLKADIQSSAGLFEALVAINYDYAEVLHYQVNLWRARIPEIADIRSQVEYVLRERHRFTEIALLAKAGRNLNDNQLAADLIGYLTEYEKFLTEIISLQQAVAQDAAQGRSDRRVPIGFSVPQFGLFIRLQIEKDILPKENLSQLFKFFAEHFYTGNARYISAENLQKKSTDIEFSTAQKMKAQLIGMVNWLNANFNLSNYS